MEFKYQFCISWHGIYQKPVYSWGSCICTGKSDRNLLHRNMVTNVKKIPGLQYLLDTLCIRSFTFQLNTFHVAFPHLLFFRVQEASIAASSLLIVSCNSLGIIFDPTFLTSNQLQLKIAARYSFYSSATIKYFDSCANNAKRVRELIASQHTRLFERV